MKAAAKWTITLLPWLQPAQEPFTELLVSRDLAGRFGFEGPLAANINLDLLGLGFGLLGEIDLQYTPS